MLEQGSPQAFEKQMEEYGYVIDFLPYGKSDDPRRQPVLQLIGDKFFTLLEAYPKPGVAFTVGERVYVGRGERDKVASIRGRIMATELTSAARSNLREVTTRIILSREAEFVNFFNRCGPINIRVHQLELIPGIGKKIMSSIIDERDKKPFESFEDIEKRIHVNRLVDFLAQRIEEELQGSKYYLFVRPARYR
ncbi:MAG: DUF655 domain-containing protein [Candidatus Micrarchaeota archaeon]|nr:DUF655 domain-containing protein [Candidatus Micrarchaeota archaeon]